MPGRHLAVVELSASFGALWPDLAEELGLPLRLGAPDGLAPGAVAIILAAGGEEQAALDLMPAVRGGPVPIFVVGASNAHRTAIEAVRRGATDYFALPADLDALRRTLAGALEAWQERERPQGVAFDALVGSSPAMQAVLARARRVLDQRDVTVLIGGETGTGKELLAQALHYGGPRAGGPFVPLNCAAIPAQLLESELFGHERGAFTDARESKPGLVEAADGGTLFLDEIGHLPLPLQGKLLRVLEGGEVRRVGATKDREVDVRFIAASHVNLAEASAAGTFREDLYYRLNVIRLDLPPLRDRGDDILLLTRHFVEDAASRYGVPAPPLMSAVAERIRGYAWPGNVRELRHAVERAILLSPSGTIDVDELIPPNRSPGGTPAEPADLLRGTLDDVIWATTRAALDAAGGNKSQAARRLGISRTRLLRILARGDT